MTAVRVALVGTGWWATAIHLPALQECPQTEVVAVCDPDVPRAQRVADRYAVARVFASVDELIAAGVADAVIVATPHATHYPIAAACLDAGLHVLVEKTMTLTAADAFALVAKAESAGLHLAVGYTYQYASTAPFVQETVQSGIGELVQVVVEFTSNAGDLYARAGDPDDERPDTPHPSTYSRANGGGQAHTQLTHAMGMACWATGRQVAEVSAFTNGRGLDVDVDDVAAFRFSGGGLGVAASTGTTANGQEVRHHIRYIGTERTLEQNLLTGDVRVLSADGGVDMHRAEGGTYRSARPSQAFVELIRGVGPNLSPARPAAATVAFLEAMLEAAQSGRRVPVPQLPPVG